MQLCKLSDVRNWNGDDIFEITDKVIDNTTRPESRLKYIGVFDMAVTGQIWGKKSFFDQTMIKFGHTTVCNLTMCISKLFFRLKHIVTMVTFDIVHKQKMINHSWNIFIIRYMVCQNPLLYLSLQLYNMNLQIYCWHQHITTSVTLWSYFPYLKPLRPSKVVYCVFKDFNPLLYLNMQLYNTNLQIVCWHQHITTLVTLKSYFP